MPNASPFTIETPNNSLRLDGDRKAQARFTVYNASGRAQRVRAMLVTQPPEARAWLTMVGDEYRQFPVAGTESYAVDVVVPPEGAAGNYTLRLDVQGEDDPDRSHVQGPPVSFEVQVPEPPPPPPKLPRWLLPVLGLVVVAAAAFFILRPRDALVPETRGISLREGIDLLESAGLTFGDLPITTSSAVAEGHVISSAPAAGENVPRGSAVDLTISSGSGPIVCVRAPCPTPPWVGELGEFVNEAIRIEPTPNGNARLLLNRELMREQP